MGFLSGIFHSREFWQMANAAQTFMAGIAQPIINEIASHNTQKTACDESHAVFITKLLKSYSNFFGKGLNNEFLVDLAGVEPASESPSIRASPITVIILAFPPSNA